MLNMFGGFFVTRICRPIDGGVNER
jgi:hypothetical protein